MTCRVDGRWTLKINCIVPPVLIKNNKDTVQEADDEYIDMLWTAPEMLRMATKPCYGTQKGDVYSFSIIANEILCRASPFCVDELTAKGISVYPILFPLSVQHIDIIISHAIDLC